MDLHVSFTPSASKCVPVCTIFDFFVMRILMITASLGLVVLTAMISGCAAPAKDGYVPAYHSANESTRVSKSDSPSTLDRHQIDDKLENFKSLYSDLKQPNLDRAIEKTYAEDLYFNDTLHTFTDRKFLSEYLLATAAKVDSTTVEFDEIAQSGSSMFIRWTMNMAFRVNGDPIQTESIGVSQIRFNGNGQVIFHQDFWDNTEGLLRHLPIVGNVINRTMKRM